MIRKSIILSKFCEECIFIIYYSFLSLSITMQLCSSGVVLQSPTFLKSILIWAFFYLKFMHFSLKYWVEEWVEWFKFFCDSGAWFHRLTVWSCHLFMYICWYVLLLRYHLYGFERINESTLHYTGYKRNTIYIKF